MAGLFTLQATIANKHPAMALVALGLITVALGSGLFLTTEAGDQNEAFLPEDSELAIASAKIQEDFAAETTGVPVQLIVRLPVLEPASLQAVLDASAAAGSDPAVAPYLAQNPYFSVAHLLLPLLGQTDYAQATQADVDSAVAAAQGIPQLAAALDSLVGCDGACSLAMVTLDSSLGSETDLNTAQLAMEDAINTPGIRTFSGAKLNQEMSESQGASTALLMGAALLIILVVLVIFYRTGSDVALSIGGLVLTIVWVFGMQGLLGPAGIGLIGADNPMAMMIPILLIGLTVDYALQFTGRYREDLAKGATSQEAVAEAVRHGGLPLFLAASTTTVSFLTNLTSSLPPMQDFGIIAGVGVMFGWLVMTTFVPACRTLFDRRRERLGKPLQTRSMAEAIPGVGKFIGGLSGTITRHPLPILGVIAAVSVASFIGAANVSTTFSTTDFLPENTESYEDLSLLEDAFGGGTSTATILVEGDLLDARMMTVLSFIQADLDNPQARPDGITGPIQKSLFTLIADWATDSGLPDDNYDEDFALLVAHITSGDVSRGDVQALYDATRELDPAEFDSVAKVDGTQGRTIIVVPIDPSQAASVAASLEAMGRPVEQFGGAFTPTGADLLAVTVTEEMTDSQLQSIFLTIGSALVVLTLFFWISERKPALGVITVLPIALVVGWVLGSMYLLGISYNVMTALITALTIGVGVDYTIHVTHRFLEELEEEGQGIATAVREALTTTGGALLGSALTTTLGFGVLLFSPLAPMQQFGGLTALTILFSLLASLLALPPMLVLYALYERWKHESAHARLGPAPEDKHIHDQDFILAGVRGPKGAPMTCPKCTNVTFVPHGLPRLQCPTYGCSFRARNPYHR